VVRPVSQSVVVQRLLGRLFVASCLRWALELVALPLVMAPGLVVDVSARTAPAPPIAVCVVGGAARPAPASPGEAAFVSTVPTADGPETETRVVPKESDDWAAMVEPRNRAEGRISTLPLRARIASPRHSARYTHLAAPPIPVVSNLATLTHALLTH
jgi:hypothetical protein